MLRTVPLAQLLKIPLALGFWNLSQQHRTQQRTPEDGPCFIARDPSNLTPYQEQGLGSESQATSGEARPRGETGEELFRKAFFPLGGKMKQLARLPQQLFTLRAAKLMRRNGTHEAMAGGGGIALLNQRSSSGECDQLTPQPSQQPPDGAVIERSLVNVASAGRCHVACDSSTGAGRFPIRLPVLLDVTGGQRE